MKLERQQFIKEYTGFNFNTYIITLDIPQGVKFKLLRLADLLGTHYQRMRCIIFVKK